PSRSPSSDYALSSLCICTLTPSSYSPPPSPALPFFFLLLRPPPTSTLFPYTTLFRSAWTTCRAGSAARRRWPTSPARWPGRDARDRQSTRLNSSHRTISYAVFCLKKKKKNKETKNKKENNKKHIPNNNLITIVHHIQQ